MKRLQRPFPPERGIEDNLILTQHQKDFLRAFSKSDIKNLFRLTGGTALSAFYLEHRLSEDLDFFSQEKIPFYIVEDFLKSLDFIDTITYTRLFDRNIFSLTFKDGMVLKTEFAYYPLKDLEKPNMVDGVPIDSFLDIVVNKLCAMLVAQVTVAERIEPKDYSDLYCALISSNLPLDELIDLAEKKCEIKGIRHILKARLLQVPEGIENLPLKVAFTKADIERLFRNLIKESLDKELS
jgi:predicted nucleotidyltransferase component of viral defense system